jgi:hypothetical protein
LLLSPAEAARSADSATRFAASSPTPASSRRTERSEVADSSASSMTASAASPTSHCRPDPTPVRWTAGITSPATSGSTEDRAPGRRLVSFRLGASSAAVVITGPAPVEAATPTNARSGGSGGHHRTHPGSCSGSS